MLLRLRLVLHIGQTLFQIPHTVVRLHLHIFGSLVQLGLKRFDLPFEALQSRLALFDQLGFQIIDPIGDLFELLFQLQPLGIGGGDQILRLLTEIVIDSGDLILTVLT